MTDRAPARLEPVGFSDLEGWTDDDHLAAWRTFRRSAIRLLASPPTQKPLGPDAAGLAAAARALIAAPEATTPAEARAFFERRFAPHRIVPATGSGFVTGYYEPVVAASQTRSAAFPVPLLGPPPGLREIRPDDNRGDLPADVTWAIEAPDGRLVACPDRGAVMDGALNGRAPVLAFVASEVEALLVHVQGSARLSFADGSVRRLSFAGKSGHPYFAVSRAMVERGLATPAEATADRMRAWLESLEAVDLRAVLGRNRSYIFFREAPVADPELGPVAAAGVPLTPGRSLAIDRSLLTSHAPLFVEADLDEVAGRFRRLMIAQDTGSAILGPARGDLFFGSGEAAWTIAARVRHAARFTLLLPRGERS
jgi:membrane-bound lytic murein transglycosylase A